jgi:hypothetical protein
MSGRENVAPDMEIALVWNAQSELWEASVYYPGFNIESHWISKHENFSKAKDSVVHFLNNEGWNDPTYR